MTESEVWKDVVGYEGIYKVSNKGNVRRVEWIGARGRECGGRTLKPKYDKDGYSEVTLCKNGMMKSKRSHRLVAEAFIPNPNGLPQVNHIDEVKDNNNVENLEWCTSKYNSNHGTSIERRVKAQSKKVRAINVETGEVITFNSASEARRSGYHKVSQACRGAYKSPNGNLIRGDGRTYKGYKWYYEEEEEKCL